MTYTKLSPLVIKNDSLSKSYDWLTNILAVQKRWLSNRELWAAYPFKKTISIEAFTAVIAEMKKVTEIN